MGLAGYNAAMATDKTADKSLDFWISYNKADEGWATWIAWILEKADYSVVLQAWDFRPGANFVLEMQKAAESATRTIAVFSPAYLGAKYPQPEWAAALAKDPTGENRSLIPVVVEECKADGLLGQIIHINLVGLDQQSASKKLLAGLEPGRAKPLAPPAFPGHESNPQTESTSPAAPTLAWTPVSSQIPVQWRHDLQGVRREGGASALELHLVPVHAQNLQVRMLSALKEDLVTIGRQFGLFTPEEGVDSLSSASVSYCQSQRPPHNSGSGLLVTRTGQRGVWFTLPHDALGSILDFADIKPRIDNLVKLLGGLDIRLANEYGFALRVAPCVMLDVGQASVIGARSSSSLPFAMSQPDGFSVLPTDTVDASLIVPNSADIADELVARLEAEARR